MTVLAEGNRDARGQWIPKELPAPAAPFRKPLNNRVEAIALLCYSPIL